MFNPFEVITLNRPGGHAMSRYTGVTERLIEQCQAGYIRGQNLNTLSPTLDAVQTAILISESFEADQFLVQPVQRLMTMPLSNLSDWSLTVLATIFDDIIRHSRDASNPTALDFDEDALKARSWAALENTLDSPTISPMVYYDDVFLDLAQEYRLKKDPHALDLLKRLLAHNQRYNQAQNTDFILRELADTYLYLDQLEAGLNIYIVLMASDPADIWTYNSIALTFDRLGLTDLGAKAVHKGLALLEIKPEDKDVLEKQLRDSLDDMAQSEHHGREADVPVRTLERMERALALDFEAGQKLSPVELCRELVPDLDQSPVKRPPTMPKLPPPEVVQRFRQVVAKTGANEPPGRNDPCWCGSGKKYKKCHMRADQEKARR